MHSICIVIQRILSHLFKRLTQFSYKFDANSNMHSALQLTRKQRTRTVRANHRVLIFEKSENILRYNRADRFFHQKRHVSPITRQRSSATRDPRNHTYREIPCPLSAEWSIDDVDIEHYNFCIRIWRTIE